MSPALASLQLLLVSLNWIAAPGTTYTVQTSTNLLEWQTEPFVIEGIGQQEQHPIELADCRNFVRLQFSTDGDSNGNGLPDLWEWNHFGHLDCDPDGDPDGDGSNTHSEWQAGTDPTDFFNGELPVIKISSGSEWYVPASQPVEQVLAFGIYHLDGRPWRQAPVRIQFESGFEGIKDELNSNANATIDLLTDDLGRLSSSDAAFYFLAPDQSPQTERILISCGNASSRLIMRTREAMAGGGPRQVEMTVLTDSEIEYQWGGSIEEVSMFRIQELDTSGNWLELVAQAPSNLPDPDPATNRFILTINK